MQQHVTAMQRLYELCQGVLPYVPHQHQPAVQQISERLTSPLRVAVIGRVSAGKSTLVNALIGRRLAATAAEDCTRLISVFQYGAPDRAELVRMDGRRERIGTSDSATWSTNLPDPASVSHVEVFLQSGPLQQMVLIDTPGLESISADAPAHRLIDSDVVLYLFRGAIRVDDVDVVSQYIDGDITRSRSTALAVGLLAHADAYGDGGWGEADAIDAARLAAQDVRRQLSGHFSDVLAICGLMAESLRTGALSEDDARWLRGMADRDTVDLEYARQLANPEVDADQAERIGSLVGGYGVNAGRRHSGSLAELGGWLDERSGLPDLERHVRNVVSPIARRARAERALDDLTRALRAPGCEQAAAQVEQASHSPFLHSVQEFRAYRHLSRQAPDSPLVEELTHLMAAETADLRAAWIGGGNPQETVSRAHQHASRLQAVASTSRIPQEVAAARTMSTSYLFLARELTGR